MRDTAKYVSGTLKEWVIKSNGSMWYVAPYNGGENPECLKGFFMSHNQCEEALIAYLRRTDKFEKAIYPGSPFVRKANGG